MEWPWSHDPGLGHHRHAVPLNRAQREWRARGFRRPIARPRYVRRDTTSSRRTAGETRWRRAAGTPLTGHSPRHLRTHLRGRSGAGDRRTRDESCSLNGRFNSLVTRSFRRVKRLPAKSIHRCAALSAIGSCSVTRRPASATSTPRSHTTFLVKRVTLAGNAAGGVVATAYARPSTPIAACLRGNGSAFASFGSTSESGDNGTPNSPMAVRSSNRPATLPSLSSVAAVIFPPTSDVRWNVTVSASPGAIISICRDGPPETTAPTMLRVQIQADEVGWGCGCVGDRDIQTVRLAGIHHVRVSERQGERWISHQDGPSGPPANRDRPHRQTVERRRDLHLDDMTPLTSSLDEEFGVAGLTWADGGNVIASADLAISTALRNRADSWRFSRCRAAHHQRIVGREHDRIVSRRQHDLLRAHR